ncbi:hypothetical protein STAS_17878 [Striga asiatica]|uniref:Transmembrane protein n=1 Tax=Striga asiatica TaxID=4170 RepID=A0A5A7Q7E3_STRAF|nr:hypothetical protein STAS_17878 [Striga asiatica]
MSEWLTSKKIHISGVLISNLTRLCSAIHSHPLYFAFFVYFLPYLLKLVKFLFLSPLFIIITSILLLILLPNENLFSNIVSSQGSAKHLFLVYNSVLEKLRPEKYYESENFCGFNELEIYNAVFGSYEAEAKDEAQQIDVSEEKKGEEKRMQNLEEEKNETKKVNDITAASEHYPMEKEWKRSLACKLLDERCEEEGMDLLWETYENESNKMKAKNDYNNMKNKKKQQEEEDGYDSEDDQVRGGLCCLQALKFSSVKMMNLGIGKPNLVRFSKAAKGIGWLRNVKKKHSKKVHNNGD